VSWVMLSVGLAFAGLVVLAACAIKVFLAVRVLARQVERTWKGLEPRQATLRERLRDLGGVRE
jgi:hypothetical protein